MTDYENGEKYKNNMPHIDWKARPKPPSPEPKWNDIAGIEEYKRKLTMYQKELDAYAEYEKRRDTVNSAWGAEDRRLFEIMKQDMFKECGIEKHPKREKAFSIAKEQMDGENMNNVFYLLQDISEVMK